MIISASSITKIIIYFELSINAEVNKATIIEIKMPLNLVKKYLLFLIHLKI